jgi:hypothetical protein
VCSYVFVLNMIGIHAGVLCLLGRFSSQLHHSYSLWYMIGTAGALVGPARYLVGWQPFQSLEQLGPLGVFGMLQLLMLCDLIRRRTRTTMSEEQYMMLRVKVFGAAVLLAAIGVMFLPSGFIGPLSARVRGLFIKHTKTGNPLVDSVAEHQATPPTVYWQYCEPSPLDGPPLDGPPPPRAMHRHVACTSTCHAPPRAMHLHVPCSSRACALVGPAAQTTLSRWQDRSGSVRASFKR